jgi:hypothetical protein
VVLGSLTDFPSWYAGFRDDLIQEHRADDH